MSHIKTYETKCFIFWSFPLILSLVLFGENPYEIHCAYCHVKAGIRMPTLRSHHGRQIWPPRTTTPKHYRLSHVSFTLVLIAHTWTQSPSNRWQCIRTYSLHHHCKVYPLYFVPVVTKPRLIVHWFSGTDHCSGSCFFFFVYLSHCLFIDSMFSPVILDFFETFNPK